MTRLLCSSTFGFAADTFEGVYDEVVIAPVTDWEMLARDADAIALPASESLPEGVLRIAEQCRALAVFGAGTDGIDVPLATELGILVANTPGIPTKSVADLTLALLLMLERRLEAARALAEQGATIDPADSHGNELAGRTIGLVGFGHIGRAVARRAAGFGMKISYCRATDADEAGSDCVRLPFDELLRGADVLSIHCPLTDRTRGLVDRSAFALLPEHAVLVNTARAQVVDEDSLVWALDSGRLAGAALDVWEGEPAPPRRFLGRANVVLSPHLGGATRQARARMQARLREHLVAIAEDRLPANIVDRAVLESPNLRLGGVRQP